MEGQDLCWAVVTERPAGPKAYPPHGGIPKAFYLQFLHWVKLYSESNYLNFPLQKKESPNSLGQHTVCFFFYNCPLAIIFAFTFRCPFFSSFLFSVQCLHISFCKFLLLHLITLCFCFCLNRVLVCTFPPSWNASFLNAETIFYSFL